MWVKRDEGIIHKILGMSTIVFIIVCYLVVIELRRVTFLKSQLEDALVQGNMAVAIVDIYKYGMEDEVIFLSVKDSYERNKKFLEEELDVNRLSVKGAKVELLDSRFYEVRKTEIVEYVFGEEGMLSVRQHPSTEEMETPNGSIVEVSAVYSKIGVDFEVFHILPIHIEMELSVDIAQNL